MEADRQPESEPVAVGSIVRAAIASFGKRSPARAVTLYEAPAVPIALGNTDLVYLVIDNLLTNADKYSPDNAPIEVTVQTGDHGSIEVRVRDYGIGLEEEELGEIAPVLSVQARGGTCAGGGPWVGGLQTGCRGAGWRDSGDRAAGRRLRFCVRSASRGHD